MTDEEPSVGERLRYFREMRKLTRTAIARRSGLSATEIEKIETGETDPPVGTLRGIAGAIGVSLAQLFALPPAPMECSVRFASPARGEASTGANLIPVPLVTGQVAGGNARLVDESILDWLFLPWDDFGRRAGSMVAVQIRGRSMEPELPDGCVVAVDRNDRVITSNGIFALREDDGGCTVKRVEVLDPSYLALVPSNRAEFRVEFWKLAPGESVNDRVIGRVVWVGINLLRTNDAPESSPPHGRRGRRRRGNNRGEEPF